MYTIDIINVILLNKPTNFLNLWLKEVFMFCLPNTVINKHLTFIEMFEVYLLQYWYVPTTILIFWNIRDQFVCIYGYSNNECAPEGTLCYVVNLLLHQQKISKTIFHLKTVFRKTIFHFKTVFKKNIFHFKLYLGREQIYGLSRQ